ncbi:MAG: DUF1080 domain-containing protein [Pirellulaceae bacterium]|nr:DUF1080 domain-containing protein [Pirellulaceae bacterium]
MSRRSLSLAATMALVLLGIASRSASADDNGWVTLFDGQSLAGWTQKNGTATYRVEDGTIVGTTSEGSPNSFLCTDKDYGDFELMFEVKVDDRLNSGVQIRSRSVAEYQDGRVHGPQVEIAVGGMAGRIYGESLDTGWLSDEGDAVAQAAFKPGAWNHYRVRAVGRTIETWVNGVPTAVLVDDKTNMSCGFIGLQVHGIGAGEGPYEVRWRNIRVRELAGK